MCILSAPPLVSCSSAKCKVFLKTGMHILRGWVFSGDKRALGVQNCDTLADLLCSDGVSSSWTPRQEPEKNKWWWRSDWLYWSEWHHHNCTFGTWKKQPMESCSGYEVGVTLRKQLLSPSIGHVTGCDPRWKACCIIHSSVNGFYQDHILWWPVQKYTVHPVYLKIWVEQVAGVQEIVKQTHMLQMAKRPSFLGLNNIPYIPDVCYPFIHQWTFSLFLSLG